MKKQFFRVKQLADQTFSRAGKTEVLSDDLQGAERRVEVIRNACQNTSKKLANSLLAQGQDATAIREKRLKKTAEYMLGIAMLECGDRNDEEGLLANVVVECGKLQMALANEVVEHEARVEERVVTLLHTVSEGEVPSILKHKRNLTKLILDMDSARTRYQTALKHSAGQGGTAKVDSIREELEDAELKVEQCRDQLASEMFQLISREAELSRTIVEYARLQRTYHEKALSVLDNILPDLESVVYDSHIRPVFGTPLEEHLRVTSRKIAFPIELCVCALLELGIEEEGLFRVAGGSSKVKRMKLSLDAGCLTFPTALEYRDPHVIAGVLKSYLRELPEPLMTFSLYDEWMNAARVSTSNDSRLQALWSVVQKLPDANRDNLRYLIKFLAALCRNQDVNKMSPQNVAIVIAPNLIWSPTCAQDNSNIGINMSTANFCSVIVDSLVSFADWFFPGEVDFFVTLSREATSELLNGGLTSSHLGHTRNSSGDAQLVDTGSGFDMHRTQSNSSLSDLNNSPPQGSPKPATRHKKKPVAPVPPIVAPNNQPNSNNVASKSSISSSTTTSISAVKNDKPGKPQPPSTAPPVTRPLEKPAKPPPPVLSQEKCVSIPSKVIPAPREITALIPSALEPTPRTTQMDNLSDQTVKKSLASVGFECTEPSVHSASATSASCDNTSASGDDLTQSNISSVQPGPASGTVANSSNTFGTLEKKRPQRPLPVAAPRTTLLQKSEVQGQAPLATAEDEFAGVTLRRNITEIGSSDTYQKPVVPERPATLQRPLSSSFRVPRPTSDPPSTSLNEPCQTFPNSSCPVESSNNESGGNSVEQAENHERSKLRSEKQQVSVVRVAGLSENVEFEQQSSSSRPCQPSYCTEKPERPPKPDAVPAATSHPLSSEAGENLAPIVNQFGSLPRPVRPQPPPPPPTARPRADSAAESTDL